MPQNLNQWHQYQTHWDNWWDNKLEALQSKLLKTLSNNLPPVKFHFSCSNYENLEFKRSRIQIFLVKLCPIVWMQYNVGPTILWVCFTYVCWVNLKITQLSLLHWTLKGHWCFLWDDLRWMTSMVKRCSHIAHKNLHKQFISLYY